MIEVTEHYQEDVYTDEELARLKRQRKSDRWYVVVVLEDDKNLYTKWYKSRKDAKKAALDELMQKGIETYIAAFLRNGVGYEEEIEF